MGCKLFPSFLFGLVLYNMLLLRPTVFPSVWGHDHDDLGEWKLQDMASTANSGYGLTSYKTGALLFGGVIADSDDATKMRFTNTTSFWDCS